MMIDFKFDALLKKLTGSLYYRAGVDSPTSPTLAGPYFRGALIRWAWHRRTKSDQIDGWSVQLLSQRRFERKYLWEKKACAITGN